MNTTDSYTFRTRAGLQLLEVQAWEWGVCHSIPHCELTSLLLSVPTNMTKRLGARASSCIDTNFVDGLQLYLQHARRPAFESIIKACLGAGCLPKYLSLLKHITAV